MVDGEGGDRRDDGSLSPANVFADTSVLLNYVQRGIERDFTSPLIDGDQVDLVVGVTVADELEDVSDRREDIYADFVDYLLNEGDIGDYDPTSRRPYFQENDRQHVQNIQMELSQLDDRAEIQRQLRRVTRAMRRRFEYLRDEVVPTVLFDQQPGITVLFALSDVISNDKDRNVVADAALWAAEGEDSSGVFVTMDRADLADCADEINKVLRDAQGDQWILTIALPTELAAVSDSDLDSKAVNSSSS